MGRVSFVAKCGVSRCNQWRLCGIVILCLRGSDTALPKLLWDFLLFHCCSNCVIDM